jgi:hypothetical protein
VNACFITFIVILAYVSVHASLMCVCARACVRLCGGRTFIHGCSNVLLLLSQDTDKMLYSITSYMYFFHFNVTSLLHVEA